MQTVNVKNEVNVTLRYLQQDDQQSLYNYLTNLSTESRSRFSPHLFDWHTIEHICQHLHDDIFYVVAEHQGEIVAYMLLKKGMLEGDAKRYAENHIFFHNNDVITYAPSVADTWQNTGIGSTMFTWILDKVKRIRLKHIVLWGGVQATNTRAVHFYKKHGFEQVGEFLHNHKNNYDMMLNV